MAWPPLVGWVEGPCPGGRVKFSMTSRTLHRVTPVTHLKLLPPESALFELSWLNPGAVQGVLATSSTQASWGVSRRANCCHVPSQP
jgi:hypothetical protein